MDNKLKYKNYLLVNYLIRCSVNKTLKTIQIISLDVILKLKTIGILINANIKK